jgi:hypothetical protein
VHPGAKAKAHERSFNMHRVPYPTEFVPEMNCWRATLGPGPNDHVFLDEEDLWLLEIAAWRVDRYGYVTGNVAMHRAVMKAAPGVDVDHIHNQRNDDRKSQLRICTRSQNCHNRQKIANGKTTRYKGVWETKYGYFTAQLKVRQPDGKIKRVGCGYFDTALAAAVSYDQKAVECFGEFSKTNFALGLYTKAEIEGIDLTPRKIHKFNCGFKGVYKAKGGFAVRVGRNGKSEYVGFRKTALEGALLYDLKATEFHGEHALTNASLGLL